MKIICTTFLFVCTSLSMAMAQACGDDSDFELSTKQTNHIYNGMSQNRMSFNRMSFNALAHNGITLNGLERSALVKKSPRKIANGN